MTDTIIASGGHFNESATSRRIYEQTDIDDVLKGDVDLFVVGLIRYEDDQQMTKRTGFLWKLNTSTLLFDPVDEHRWSYED